MDSVREQLAPLVAAIVDRAQASGQLRADVANSDIALLQFMVAGLAADQPAAPGTTAGPPL